MKFNIIICTIILFVSSCKNKDELGMSTSNSPVQSMLIDKNTDTVFTYHRDGKVKEKGCVINKNRIGWWKTYNTSGKLIEKSEFIIRDNSSYLNQEIYFLNDGTIDYSRSSFFELNIKDTIRLGKTVGKLKYYTNSKGYKTRFIYVYIDNEYSEKLSKTDTFTDDISKLWFGVNAYKKGRLKLKGKIEEELSFVNNLKDSSKLTIKKYNKYFEKELYVQ